MCARRSRVCRSTGMPCARIWPHTGWRLDSDPPPRQFAGGLANLNYLIHLDGKPAVLRRPPLGELPAGAYDMAREFRILSRLPDALPFVPRGLFLCDDAAVIGAAVPDHRVPARAGDPRAPSRRNWPADRRLARGCRRCCWRRWRRSMRWIPAAVGLDDLGRPDGFPGARGGRLAQARAGGDGGRHRSAACRTRRRGWSAHLVPDGAPALLHNDFKLNNMILNPRDLSPVAVVDWDQGTRGDPLFDFATLLSYWVHEDDPPALHDMAQMPADEGGFWPREQAVASVCRAERTRRVGLPVPSRAGDVQARRDLPAAWLPLAQRRHDRAALRRP